MNVRTPRAFRRSSICVFLGLCTSWPAFASTAAAINQRTPEQERVSIVNALKARLAGTTPVDWVHAPDTLASADEKVRVIPLSSATAVNTADFLAIGRKAWERKFKDGKSLANCFPHGGKRAAANYPQVDSRSGRVVTLEVAIMQCLALHGEATVDDVWPENMGAILAYFRSMATGSTVNIRVNSAKALEKFQAGKALFARRIGSENLACASCHVVNVRYPPASLGSGTASQSVAGGSPTVGQATRWPRATINESVRTIQMQFQVCMRRVGAVPFELASEEFNSLEYFHSYMSNGLQIQPLSVGE